ncbi:MAG: DUF4340 domain-containing protein [Verrucomicrobia bacterium]|nr:DUF4340 domain-containing protein [Verrucomicrobiota bacterium]MCH8527803.1 DUF4340 domain-containing protein [Kiritimatiellia bacterium]
MKAFRSLILLLLVLGLGAYIYWVDAEKESTPEREAAQRRAFSIDLDRLDGVTIRRPEYTLGLRRQGEEWLLSSPEGVPASQATVRQTLSRLRALSRGELITPADMRERGQTLADFGLAVPVAVLTLEDSRGERRYRIGNPNPLGNALYVKEESSQNVMLISSDLMEILPLRADAFRDRRILTPPANAVRGLSFHSPERMVRLEVQGDQWVLSEPFRFPAQQDRVASLLEQLASARIERFLLPDEVSGEPFGRDEDLVTLRAQFSGSTPQLELEIGNRVPGEPQSRYARFAGQEGVFVVSEGLRSLTLTELLALQKLNILPVSPEQISGFTVLSAGRTEPIELSRISGGWEIRTPMSGRASTDIAGRVLEAWTAAMIEERHPLEQASDLLYTFSVRLKDPSYHVPTEFEVYTDESNPAAVWVRPGGMNELWRIFPDTLKYVPQESLAYLSRTVLQFPVDAVIRLRIFTPEGDVTLTREDPQAPWGGPESGETVDRGRVGDVLAAFGALNAQHLLERGSVNLGDWGLEDAPYRVSVGLGGSKPGSRTLRLAPHPEWGLVGTVQGQDLVFALPKTLLEYLEPSLLLSTPSGVNADDIGASDS